MVITEGKYMRVTTLFLAVFVLASCSVDSSGSSGSGEIQNLVEYVGDGDILGSKSAGSDNWAAYLTIAPDLPEIHTYEVLRIAVVGTTSNLSDSESQKVGAFIDVPIET